MSEPHVDQGHRKFWSLMKSMTWKQRFQHIAYYYLKYALIAVFLIYMLVDLSYDALKPQPEIILSGTVVNVQISDDMRARLCDGAFSHMGGTDPEAQTTRLEPNPITFTDMLAGANLQTKLMAGDYHYALMDQTGLEKLLTLQVMPNLTEILTPEQLANFDGKLRYLQAENGTFPIAIDITGTVLAAGCGWEGDCLYLSFPVLHEMIPAAVTFMDYLLSQGLLESA